VKGRVVFADCHNCHHLLRDLGQKGYNTNIFFSKDDPNKARYEAKKSKKERSSILLLALGD
jgi:hypothetical protein